MTRIIPTINVFSFREQALEYVANPTTWDLAGPEALLAWKPEGGQQQLHRSHVLTQAIPQAYKRGERYRQFSRIEITEPNGTTILIQGYSSKYLNF